MNRKPTTSTVRGVSLRVHTAEGRGHRTYTSVENAEQACTKLFERHGDKFRIAIYPLITQEDTPRIRYQLHCYGFVDLQDAINIAHEGHFTSN